MSELGDAYSTAGWHSFFVMLGGAGASLAGLMFIALSIHLAQLERSLVLRTRARYLIAGFVIIPIASGFILMPQPLWVLGTELMVVASGYGLYSLVSLLRATRREPFRPTPDLIGRWVGMAVVIVLAIASGVSLISLSGGGIYLIASSLLLALGLEVLSAWSLLAGISEPRSPGR